MTRARTRVFGTAERMHVEFHTRGVPADSRLREHVVSGLNHLSELMPIAGADVVLEMQLDSTPAWQAVVCLEVAGRVIRAAARDHTWEGAWLKVTTRLRHEMEGPLTTPPRDTSRSQEGTPSSQR